jgi:hypothetical protein
MRGYRHPPVRVHHVVRGEEDGMGGARMEYPDEAGYPDGEGTLDEGTGAFREPAAAESGAVAPDGEEEDDGAPGSDEDDEDDEDDGDDDE